MPASPFLALVAALLPLVLCGPIRSITSASEGVSLAAALGLTAAGVALILRSGVVRRAGSRREALLRDLIIFVPALLAVAAVHNRSLGPLATYAGGDGGAQVSVSREFATSPQVYGGFVSLSGFVRWVERVVGCSAYWSFAVAFLLTVAVAGATPGLLAALQAVRRREALTWHRSLIALVCSCAALYALALPQISYIQLDGFFAQFWVVIPILLLWIADASELDGWLRALTIGGFLALARYSYGLGLGDLLAASAVIFLVDAARPGRRWYVRLAWLAAAVLAAWTAHTTYVLLAPWISRDGWIVRYNLRAVMLAEGVGAAALLVFAVAGRASWSLVRFPLLVAAANVAALTALRRIHPAEPYYLMKYTMHALVLLALAYGVVIAEWAALAFRRGEALWRRIVMTLGAAGCLAAMVMLVPEFPQHRVFLDERAFMRRDFLNVRPLADLGAWKRIEQTLKESRAKFGGYLVGMGPMFAFMNAGFDRFGNGYFNYAGIDRSPGHCVFWEERPDPWWENWDGAHRMIPIIQSLEVLPQRSCRSYKPSWRSSGTRGLCHVCF